MTYNINQPEHKIVNEVMKRLEDYLFDNGIKVVIGEHGRAIIEDLIRDYGLELTKMYDENATLDIENQNLKAQIGR